MLPRLRLEVVLEVGGVDDGRELRGMRWGVPPPAGVKSPVVNVRNYASPFWRSMLKESARRCLVPVTSFQEWSVEPDPQAGRKRPHWFSVPSRPIFSFAGVWRPTEAGPAYAFLTTGYGPVGARGRRRPPALLEMQASLGDMLDPADVDAIRRGGEAPPGILDRIVAMAHVVAEGHRVGLGPVRRARGRREATSDFLFRVGVSQVCGVLEWIRNGSQASTKPGRVRNDYVDTMISVFGTYFNGVMTGDGRLAAHQGLNRAVLSRLGATLPPAYQVLVP